MYLQFLYLQIISQSLFINCFSSTIYIYIWGETFDFRKTQFKSSQIEPSLTHNG
ncbi:hypothetical protein HanRHA438_Chr10g0464011 [Helianthus annuus]|nr:hypothetical protein HanHA89_Chr10g0393041 [Helianthus annuus]KAJ0880513.1 hypothetical protein HanRHA438_Chr10g0464011 [Helianthus annuus]